MKTPLLLTAIIMLAACKHDCETPNQYTIVVKGNMAETTGNVHEFKDTIEAYACDARYFKIINSDLYMLGNNTESRIARNVSWFSIIAKNNPTHKKQ